MMPVVPLVYSSEFTELDVISALLARPEQFIENSSILDVDLFVNESHKNIMIEFHKAFPLKVSIAHLHEKKLISTETLDSIDDSYIMQNSALLERTQFLTLLRSRREMYDAICQLVPENAASDDLEAVVNGFMTKVNGIIKKSNLKKSKIINNEGFIDRIQDRVTAPKEQLKIGFSDFDDFFKIYRNNLVTIAANTNVGKTWLGLHVYNYAVTHDYVGVFFTTEMSDDQVIDRLGGMYAESWDLDKSITHDELDKIFVNVRQAKHNIVHDSRLTAQKVRSTLIELKEKHGQVDYVVIDYLTRMETPTGKDDYRIKIGAVVKELKTLATEFNCAIFLVAQLSRKNLERTDKRPIVSDLAETKIIEDESDSLLMIYSEEYIRRKVTHQDVEHSQLGIIEIDILKNRHGAMHSGLLYMGRGGKLHQVDNGAKSQYFNSLSNKTNWSKK